LGLQLAGLWPHRSIDPALEHGQFFGFNFLHTSPGGVSSVNLGDPSKARLWQARRRGLPAAPRGGACHGRVPRIASPAAVALHQVGESLVGPLVGWHHHLNWVMLVTCFWAKSALRGLRRQC